MPKRNHQRKSEESSEKQECSFSKPKREYKKLPATKKPRILKVLDNDDNILDIIQEMAETGAAISTINAALEWPDGALASLLSKGKGEGAKAPYVRFLRKFKKWVSVSKHKAENTMAIKHPEKWLERNSSVKTVEDNDDASLITHSKQSSGNLPPGVESQTLLDALGILAEQGIVDMNEALKHKKITVDSLGITKANQEDNDASPIKED